MQLYAAVFRPIYVARKARLSWNQQHFRKIIAMIEDVLEFILELIFEPLLGNKLKKFDKKIDRKFSKPIRVIIKTVMILLVGLIIFGIVATVNYAIRGYWF